MEERNSTITFRLGWGGLCILCFIVFLVLKLCNVITWAWWLVCLPLIIYGGVIALLLLIMLILVIIALIIDRRNY